MANGQSRSEERTVHRWMCLGHFAGRSNQNARLPASAAARRLLRQRQSQLGGNGKVNG
jgi:hypothetical protein